MAFAPPRRVFSRTSEQKKRLETKEKGSAADGKVAQKVRNVIEARHREWLAIDKSSKAATDDPRNRSNDQTTFSDQANATSNSASLPHDQDLVVEDFEIDPTGRIGMNCSNGEGLVTLKKDVGRDLKGDVSVLGSAYDYHSSINKFKISKPVGWMNTSTNMYDGRPTVANQEPGISGQEVTEPPLKQPEPVSHSDLRRKADDLIHQAKTELYRYGRVSRPENHFCPFCKRLMSLEGHDPVCIIPCGHTLCESCSNALKLKCPICDHDIQTTTSNVILKRIIEKFSEEHGLSSGRPTAAISHETAGATRLSKQTPVPRSKVQELSLKLDKIEQSRRTVVENGRDVSSRVPPQTPDAADPVVKVPAVSVNSESGISVDRRMNSSPKMGASDDPVKKTTEEKSSGEDATDSFLPQIASINKALTNLLKPYWDGGEMQRPITTEKLAKSSNKEDMSDDAVFLPSEADLERWAEELAAVEMRISVMDLQARQTSTAIVNSKTRIKDARDALKLLETRENQLLDSLRFTQMQLKGVDSERAKIIQQLNNDTTENQKSCEQLNLINYTRAGLEAELEKLRLLCNRT